jgi:hypothetical protein
MRTYKLIITFSNQNDNDVKDISLLTSYPKMEDVEETLYHNGLDDFKSDGGKFDFFEITEKQLV